MPSNGSSDLCNLLDQRAADCHSAWRNGSPRGPRGTPRGGRCSLVALVRLALRRLAVASSVASSLACVTASFGVAAEPLVVRYRAFEGCPTEARFVRDVVSRIHEGDSPPVGFSVALERRGGRVVGRLDGRDRTGHGVGRELVGATCDEVASALALVLALALDPNASTAPLAAVSASASASASVVALPAAPPSSSAAVVPVRAPAPAEASAPARNEPPEEHERAAWSVGVDALALTPIAPSPALGGAAFVEVARDASGPLVRLAAIFAGRDVAISTGGSARFRYGAARLEGCPLRVLAGASVALAPCAGLELGALRGDGSGLPTSHGETRFFSALEGAARATWAVASPVSVEASIGVVAPLVRDTFVVDAPRTLVHTPPAVGATLSLGVLARFF